MNKSLLIFASVVLLLTSCKGKKNEDEVVLQRFIHKYGYDVDQAEWEDENHPGQVITTFRNGKTITETYADSLLHGEKTVTFPHSGTIQTKELYTKGLLIQRTAFNIRGVPEKETAFKSPTHLIVTTWHPTGSPKAKEEFRDSRLINGKYYSLLNETDSVITDGDGEKTHRNISGDIIAKEVYVNYEIAYTETYHQNNTPNVITSFKDGKIHGEIKKFALSGEPILVENYIHGKKHGLCTYFQNGNRFQETSYENGQKNGIEKLYIDGVTLSEESDYRDGLRHGPSVVFCDGTARTSWYFNDTKVSKSVYDQYEERAYMISSTH